MAWQTTLSHDWVEKHFFNMPTPHTWIFLHARDAADAW